MVMPWKGCYAGQMPAVLSICVISHWMAGSQLGPTVMKLFRQIRAVTEYSP
jgi:hypothetical protein